MTIWMSRTTGEVTGARPVQVGEEKAGGPSPAPSAAAAQLPTWCHRELMATAPPCWGP